MATEILFTDDDGSWTLTNGKPVPGDRFANWTPTSLPVGDAVERESDGLRIMLPLRDDFSASFELQHIPMRTVSGLCLVDIADRLIYWLTKGGTCQVNTGDSASNSYATCALKSGTTPSLQLDDPVEIEYTLSLALTNVAVSPVRMSCHYAGGT